MAKYTGLLTSDMRGKIGGVSFSKNGSGNFIRRTNVPSDKKTPIQTNYRSDFHYLASCYRGLDSRSMQEWISTALQVPFVDSLGKTYYLSGFNFFMYINQALVANGFSMISTAPSIYYNNVESLTGVKFSITTTPGNEDITFKCDNALAVGFTYIIQSTGVVSNGINYPKNFKKIISLVGPFPSAVSIKSGFINVFGSMPSTGASVWFRVWVIVDTMGWRNSKVIFQAIGTI